MEKKVLVLSYYSPPCGYGYSIRVVNFVKFLPEFGWQPTLLTVREEYYKDNTALDYSPLQQFPPQLKIVRTHSLEPKQRLKQVSTVADKKGGLRQLATMFLSIIERNFFIPDVQILWGGVAFGVAKKLVTEAGIDAILATAPPFSTLLLATLLKKATAKPLILDFKDMWVGRDQHHHKSVATTLTSAAIEKRIVRLADRVLLTTKWSYDAFCRRYPQQQDKFSIIPNGYDPQIESLVDNLPIKKPLSNRFRLVHSGHVGLDRDPQLFITVLKELTDESPQLASQLEVWFVGNVHPQYQALVNRLGLAGNFKFWGYLNYQENIAIMNTASVLLLLPTHGAPDAVPGKIYEYFFLKKPILALAAEGATRELLLASRVGMLASPNNKEEIKQGVLRLYQEFISGNLAHYSPQLDINQFSRQQQTGKLATILDKLI